MTLVEVLVGMSILALVAALIGASLRGVAASADRVDERVAALDEMRLGISALRELFARVSATSLRGDSTQDEAQRLFQASSTQVAWIAVMPARFGASGRYAFRLAAERLSDDRPALVLRFAPLEGDAQMFPRWEQAQSRVLVHDVEQFRLTYGGEGLQSDWAPAWVRRDKLPPRVRLDLQQGAVLWPPIVLPVRSLAPPKPVFTLGGGGE
jgi:general secretion pathway protein J